MTATPSTALVFGATGAVGSALAHRLDAAGWQLVVVGRDETKLSALGLDTGRSMLQAIQATEADAVEQCFKDAVDRFGAVNAVANCMGNLLLKPAHLTTDAMWHETLAINLTSSFYILRAAAKTMMRDGGSLVFVSSAAARTGFANHEAIAAAKSGIEGLVRAAAASYGGKGIRVNAVAPGLVKSQMTRGIVENEASCAVSESLHVLGRLGEPADVAAAIEWLMGSDSSWVTGQILGVDGGLAHIRTRPTAVRPSVAKGG